MDGYLDSDTIREIENALHAGQTIDGIAGQLGMDADKLARLLGRPQWKRIPSGNMVVQDSVDLWRADELEDVL